MLMQLKEHSGLALATTAALLFSTASIGTAQAEDAKVVCDGVNACKGRELSLQDGAERVQGFERLQRSRLPRVDEEGMHRCAGQGEGGRADRKLDWLPPSAGATRRHTPESP